MHAVQQYICAHKAMDSICLLLLSYCLLLLSISCEIRLYFELLQLRYLHEQFVKSFIQELICVDEQDFIKLFLNHFYQQNHYSKLGAGYSYISLIFFLLRLNLEMLIEYLLCAECFCPLFIMTTECHVCSVVV